MMLGTVPLPDRLRGQTLRYIWTDETADLVAAIRVQREMRVAKKAERKRQRQARKAGRR